MDDTKSHKWNANLTRECVRCARRWITPVPFHTDNIDEESRSAKTYLFNDSFQRFITELHSDTASFGKCIAGQIGRTKPCLAAARSPF